MLSTRPYLTINRPSPTTVNYVVSTHPRPSTLPQKLLYWALFCLRLLAGVVILSTLLFLYKTSLTSCNSTRDSDPSSSRAPAAFRVLFEDIPASIVSCYANIFHPRDKNSGSASTSGIYVLPTLLGGLLLLLLRRPYTTESLLVLRSLGIQISSQSPWYLPYPLDGGEMGLGATKRFITTTKVRDILIHEAFKGWQVRYYLGVVVDGDGITGSSATEDETGGGGMVVVFPELLPGLNIVEEVWRGAKECLYEPAAKD